MEEKISNIGYSRDQFKEDTHIAGIHAVGIDTTEQTGVTANAIEAVGISAGKASQLVDVNVSHISVAAIQTGKNRVLYM